MKFAVTLFIAFLSVITLSTSCKKIDAQSSKVVPAIVQESQTASITWYKIEDLEKMDIGNKRVLIDVYTDWCGWCKTMDAKTFSDERVIDHLNKNFVMVKFNAEQRDPIEFKGKTYEFQGSGRRGSNTLAVELLSGRMGYPTIVYLDSQLNKIKSVPGYKTPDQLLGELEVL